jgi:hypothetical protein
MVKISGDPPPVRATGRTFEQKLTAFYDEHGMKVEGIVVHVRGDGKIDYHINASEKVKSR